MRADRIGLLRPRFRDHFDEPVLENLTWAAGGRPTLATAARWRPPPWWSSKELGRLLRDAIAATALLRFAGTASDEGFATAARRHRSELVAADECMTDHARAAARRRQDGAYSHPARPGCYVNNLLRMTAPDREISARTVNRAQAELAMARNYGVVVLEAVAELVGELDDEQPPLHNCWDTCKPWQVEVLRQWRAAAGFGRAPGDWEQPPLPDAHADGPTRTLAQRIAADQAADPAVVEAPHDLLWFADLADALAPFYGHAAATVRPARPVPGVEYVAPVAPPEQVWLDAESVPLAVAGVAQLVAFGAAPPPRCRSWSELVRAVSADMATAEAAVGAFPVPPELAAMDGQVLPGTALTVQLGRGPRQLVTWSAYMGNCIGETWYAEQAHRGQCVLIALRDPDGGRIVANLDIRHRTGGWQIHELRARFNDDVPPAVEKAVQRWVQGLAAPVAPAEPVVPVPAARARGGSARRSAASRLPAELTRAVIAEVERELSTAAIASALRTYAVLARGLGPPGQPADFEPGAAVIALKRVAAVRHVELVRAALDDGLGASALWKATRERPLASAVHHLDPGMRESGRLDLLARGGELPRSLRALVRRPEIVPAHAVDVVARAVRVAMGELVGSDALARSVARRPSVELVCTVAVAATCALPSVTVQVVPAGATAVPGFPATDLLDAAGPWQRALGAAADLGAPVAQFEQHLAEHGLRVPAALLGRGGWPALWSRAHR